MLQAASIPAPGTTTAVRVCGGGEGITSNRLCELVLDRTGNQMLARFSGYRGVGDRIKVGEEIGVVERMELRSTAFREPGRTFRADVRTGAE